jgi:hypothetical protein
LDHSFEKVQHTNGTVKYDEEELSTIATPPLQLPKDKLEFNNNEQSEAERKGKELYDFHLDQQQASIPKEIPFICLEDHRKRQRKGNSNSLENSFKSSCGGGRNQKENYVPRDDVNPLYRLDMICNDFDTFCSNDTFSNFEMKVEVSEENQERTESCASSTASVTSFMPMKEFDDSLRNDIPPRYSLNHVFSSDEDE